MEETTTTQEFSLETIHQGIITVGDVLNKIMTVYRTIIDAIKSVIKPVLKSAFDGVLGGGETTTGA